MTWHDEAACKGEPDAVMYPAEGDRDAIRIALSLCADCPVKAECYGEWASMPHALRGHGIWFATTPAQRARNRDVIRWCDDCGIPVSRAGTRCRSCAQAHAHRRKTAWDRDNRQRVRA